jgi:L-iditol 2-dehydrogenase
VRAEYPLLGGHEVGATVLEAPPRCGIAPGDVVAVSLLPRCGCCRYCDTGRSNLCAYNAAKQPADGQPRGPGGMSELLAVPLADVYPLGPDVTCAQAALVEPVACVIHSLQRTGCRPDDLLIVFGAGFTGALHLACARSRGMRTAVVLTERETGPVEVPAADLTIVSGSADAIVAALRDKFGAAGGDAAVVTRGGAAAVRTATDVVRPGGGVILFQSIYNGERIELDPARLRSREIVLGGAVSHTAEDFTAAATLVRAGTVDLAPLIDRTFDLTTAREALSYAVAHPGRRTLVAPGGR